ncbi:hypothetical protein [Mycolicibacterium austroafricanum]|uniref:hypothetical protein n=1 Tax=Mycolicibacterium austroafricanum TaxID=39687 RepID=UPI001CA33643|nr:hypothetical protein [Mycolicibacterium austroafricanum]QZT60932.1 hypothetical protein JN085_18180 [Mycolicibacterium austroafricanum]
MTAAHTETVRREHAALELALAMASGSPQRQRVAHQRIADLRPRTRRLAVYLRCIELVTSQLGQSRAEAVENLRHHLASLTSLCVAELDDAASTRLCSIPERGRPHDARGWCRTHYTRWQRHGDPAVVEPGGRLKEAQ